MSGEDRIEEAAREIDNLPDAYVPGADGGWYRALKRPEGLAILRRLYDDGKKAGRKEEAERYEALRGTGGS